VSGWPSPSVSTVAHSSVGNASSLSPIPSESVSNHSLASNGNTSTPSSYVSSSVSASNGSVPAVASSESETVSPSSSLSSVVPAGLVAGVEVTESSVNVVTVPSADQVYEVAVPDGVVIDIPPSDAHESVFTTTVAVPLDRAKEHDALEE